MKKIAVAGASGDIGARILASAVASGSEVVALVRPGTSGEKRKRLERPGVRIVEADFTKSAGVARELAGVGCVVSTLQGLREVIVDLQSSLLEAARAAGVPRFIPSDFASDFSNLPKGDNRNFDLRRDFHERLSAATAIHPTSIYNGAFAEILAYGTPLLDLKTRRVGYWGVADWRIEFTTKDDAAAFTAAAALDASTPRALRIASFQISPRELAALATELTGAPFELVPMGSVEELAAYNRRERAAHPEGESEVFPRWQQSQYLHSMFSTHVDVLDNGRYPSLEWTSAEVFLSGLLAKRQPEVG